MPLIMLNPYAEAAQQSIHSANIEEVYEMPLNEILRPIPPDLDEVKVQSIIETLQVIKHSTFYTYFIFLMHCNSQSQFFALINDRTISSIIACHQLMFSG